MITIGDLLQQDLPLAVWNVVPVLGSPEVTGTLWEEQAGNLQEWADYLGAPVQAVKKGRAWMNSARGFVDGTAVVIWCALPYDLTGPRPATAAAS
jgi:hypothetical protein